MTAIGQFVRVADPGSPSYAEVMRASVAFWSAILILSIPTFVGCAPPPVSEGGFDAADPASKSYAIERAAADRDRARIPQLVEQLRSDDPLVRMMAIETLERLTGRTMGYRHFDPEAARAAAIRRWVAAVESGEFAAEDDRPAQRSVGEAGVADAR